MIVIRPAYVTHLCHQYLYLSSVLIKQLAAWVILEDSFDKICAFLGQTFGEYGSIALRCITVRILCTTRDE